MARIIATGELLLDILIRDGNVVSSLPGGSMLNSSISLSRAGVPVSFVGITGNDPVGGLILEKLAVEGVDTKNVIQTDTIRSGLGIGLLDTAGEAAWTFYREQPSIQSEVFFPDVNQGDVLLFGSFYSLQPAVRSSLMPFLRKARHERAIVYYDPNFRRPHLNELPAVRPFITENIDMADIVRGSSDDFLMTLDSNVPEVIFRKIGSDKNKALIVTSGPSDIHLVTSRLSLVMAVPAIKTISTVGAGDAFNAGVIYALHSEGVMCDDLPFLGENDWQLILQGGIRFATDVCSSHENYISHQLAQRLISERSCRIKNGSE